MLVLKKYIFMMLMVSLNIYNWIVIIYCIAGFFVRNRYAGWYVFLSDLVEPPLRLIRRLTQNRLVIDRLDLSPVILILGLQLLASLLRQLFL